MFFLLINKNLKVTECIQEESEIVCDLYLLAEAELICVSKKIQIMYLNLVHRCFSRFCVQLLTTRFSLMNQTVKHPKTTLN